MTTQAQIDQLKAAHAQEGALINALTPDGPGPVPPPTGELWTSYNSAYMGNCTYYPVGVDASGNPGNPPESGGVFLSQYVGADKGMMIWGTGTEHFSVMTDARGGGEKWSAVIGYGATADPSILYPEEIVRCDWKNLDTGAIRDMGGFTVGPVGGIMCPLILPASGRYKIRQWGWIHNSPTGGRVRTFYWEATYEFGLTLKNPAWTKDALTTRKAVKMEEAWWDEAGWVRGHAPTLPWIDGKPVDVTVTYDGWQAFAKDAGTMWKYMYSDYRVALQRTT